MSFYNYTLKSFGADTMIMIGNPPVHYEHTVEEITYENYVDLISALDAHASANVVTLYLGKDVEPHSLRDYRHPVEDVIYLTGSDYGEVNYPVLKGRSNLDYVCIEMAGTQSLWAHVAIAVALHDRVCKGS